MGLALGKLLSHSHTAAHQLQGGMRYAHCCEARRACKATRRLSLKGAAVGQGLPNRRGDRRLLWLHQTWLPAQGWVPHLQQAANQPRPVLAPTW